MTTADREPTAAYRCNPDESAGLADADRERRYAGVILAAHLATMNPGARDAWDDLCAACERITDAELEALAHA